MASLFFMSKNELADMLLGIEKLDLSQNQGCLEL